MFPPDSLERWTTKSRVSEPGEWDLHCLARVCVNVR